MLRKVRGTLPGAQNCNFGQMPTTPHTASVKEFKSAKSRTPLLLSLPYGTLRDGKRKFENVTLTNTQYGEEPEISTELATGDLARFYVEKKKIRIRRFPV